MRVSSFSNSTPKRLSVFFTVAIMIMHFIAGGTFYIEILDDRDSSDGFINDVLFDKELEDGC